MRTLPIRFQASTCTARRAERGHAHFVGIGARQEAQPEDLKAVDRRHAVQIFVHRADQHLPPEAVDGVRRLALLQQPVEHADAVQVLAARAFAADARAGRARSPVLSARLRQCMRRKEPVK